MFQLPCIVFVHERFLDRDSLLADFFCFQIVLSGFDYEITVLRNSQDTVSSRDYPLLG